MLGRMTRKTLEPVANAPDPSRECPPADPRVAQCRKMVSRKAMVSAGVALVPIPGLDVAADIALLTRLITQIEALSPDKRARAFKAIQWVGSSLIGSAVTRELVLMLLRKLGLRFSAKQVSRYVPLVGQAASAAHS